MGAFALVWEAMFDITSLATDPKHAKDQFMGMLDLCRLNMYIVGLFLITRKINCLKWVVATSLWGGVSTLFDHYNNTAAFHSLISHAVVLAIFPSLAITISKTNYSFSNYVYAHFFNWTIVLILIITNYWWGKHAGELTEAELKDNALVGFMPYGGRMILWIFVAMIIEFCYFLIYRFIYWITYEKQNTKFWPDFAQNARDGWGEIQQIPSHRKTDYVNFKNYIKKLSEDYKSKIRRGDKK